MQTVPFACMHVKMSETKHSFCSNLKWLSFLLGPVSLTLRTERCNWENPCNIKLFSSWNWWYCQGVFDPLCAPYVRFLSTVAVQCLNWLNRLQGISLISLMKNILTYRNHIVLLVANILDNYILVYLLHILRYIFISLIMWLVNYELVIGGIICRNLTVNGQPSNVYVI